MLKNAINVIAIGGAAIVAAYVVYEWKQSSDANNANNQAAQQYSDYLNGMASEDIIASLGTTNFLSPSTTQTTATGTQTDAGLPTTANPVYSN